MAQYIYSRKTVTAYIKKVCDDYFEFDIAWKSRSRKLYLDDVYFINYVENMIQELVSQI